MRHQHHALKNEKKTSRVEVELCSGETSGIITQLVHIDSLRRALAGPSRLALAPLSKAYLMVGMAASIRCVLVILSPFNGTLKSTRASCRI